MAVDVWRNFISKPRLNTFVSDVAEVGYSHYGPTFAVSGTLTAENKFVLVYNICTEITNTNKKTAHFLDWFAFRPTHHVMGNFSELNLSMASKFTIVSGKPLEYNVLFIDNVRFAEMKPLLSAVKDTWEKFLPMAENNKEEPEERSKAAFAEFLKLEIVTEATERLKSLTYWEPASYLVKIRVTTKNPKQVFDTEKSFLLDEPSAQLLSNNATKIIANICQQSQAQYACATPSFVVKE